MARIFCSRLKPFSLCSVPESMGGSALPMPIFCSEVGWRHASVPFDQHRDPHPAANTKRRQSAFRLSFLHFMQQRSRDSHTRATNRMTQSNSAAVHVEAFMIELQIAIAGNDLRRERLVQF